MRINTYIRNPSTVGITSIYFSVVWCSKRLILQAGESIHTADWDNKKYQVKQKATTAMLKGRLNKMEQKIRDEFEQLIKEYGLDSFTPKMLKDRVLGKRKIAIKAEKKQPEIRIVDFIQRFIDDTKNGIRLSTKKTAIKKQSAKPYGNIKKAFAEFETEVGKKLHFRNVDQDLLDEFELYLIHDKKLATNTRGKYMQMLLVVLKYAEKRKLLARDTLLNLKIVVATEESDSIYLNEKELEAFGEYKNPENPYLEFIRDMFLIGSYSALRHSDFSRLTEKNFFEKRIRTIQQKIGKKAVITIHPMAKKVISKYKNGFPYACPTIPHEFNEQIRLVAKEIKCLDMEIDKIMTKGTEKVTITKKKYEWISSHVCRRSFCTNEFLAGMNVELIMAMSGHTSYKSFKAYIKASLEEKADAVERIWEERYKHLRDEEQP
jgi:site-specific recombinase XerD